MLNACFDLFSTGATNTFDYHIAGVLFVYLIYGASGTRLFEDLHSQWCDAQSTLGTDIG